MALYTTNYFRNLAQNKQYVFEQRSKNLIGESKLFAESKIKGLHFDIFLSHSNLDREVIKGIFIELSEIGLKVYVDWIIDPHLDRSNVTRKTAETVRERMKQSSCLFHATSDNSSKSKWMPWETGWKDGDNQRVAILPVSDYYEDDFEGQEFLSLYPYIKKEASALIVVDPETQRTQRFDAWRKRFIFS